MPMRIAVVTPIPTPYRDSFWNVVARQPEIELSVFYCSEGKGDRPWEVDWPRNYRSEVLPGRNLARWQGTDASCFWNPSIVKHLQAGHYDALVIGGYNHPTMWAAMRYAVRRGLPYFVMCESHLKKCRPVWKRWLKGPAVRWVVKHAAGGFPTGVLAERYLTSYGADRETLIRIPNAPDVVKLARTTAELRGLRHNLRQQYGLDNRLVVLFVARLIPKKRADLLIRAFRRVSSSKQARLVLVGDGPERPKLEALVEQLCLSHVVHFTGFVQPEDVATWYTLADLFVLPSSETWGVAVLEALASGLPVIVTDEVGCHHDVINDPVVGDAIPARDEVALAEALERRLSFPVPPSSIQQVWTPVRDSLRYDKIAQRFAARVATVLHTGRPPTSVLRRNLSRCTSQPRAD